MVVAGFLGRKLGESADDHDVTCFGQVSGCAVYHDGPGSRRGSDRVGFESAPVGPIPDMNLLVRQDSGEFQERGIHGNTPLVIEFSGRNVGAMDFRFE